MANHDPWMTFVDGENLTIRAQELAKQHGHELEEGRTFKRDCFVWFKHFNGTNPLILNRRYSLETLAVRSYYYTSAVGDEGLLSDVKDKLWNLRFHPQVYKKPKKDQKAKGVDIALTKDMLTHAFFSHYHVAILIAGDGDYVPLVQEVKRLGRRVFVAFFAHHGLNDSLRLESDLFIDLTESFLHSCCKSK
jgi:hypothetical protein